MPSTPSTRLRPPLSALSLEWQLNVDLTTLCDLESHCDNSDFAGPGGPLLALHLPLSSCHALHTLHPPPPTPFRPLLAEALQCRPDYAMRLGVSSQQLGLCWTWWASSRSTPAALLLPRPP